MKIMAGLVAVAAMGLSQVAQAQEACEPFKALIDYAWEDFDEIVGAERDDGSYEADYQFDGADQCSVTIDIFAEYGCVFTSASEAEGVAVYDEALSLFEACLPDWTREDLDLSDSGSEFTSVRALIAVGPGDFGDLEWFLSLDRHNRSEGPDWHFSIGLTYY